MRVRAGSLCVHDGKLLMVLLREPSTGTVLPFPPGGAIEANESPAQAARRETLEETGYSIGIVEECHFSVTYEFLWGGKIYPCKTEFLLANLDDSRAQADVDDEDFVVGSEWVPLAEVHEKLAFHPVLQKEITRFLEKKSSQILRR